MALGPGKYGAQAEKLLHEIGGELCLVLILEGPQGPSFDVATARIDLLGVLPAILRAVADGIAEDLRSGTAVQWRTGP